MFKSIYIIKNNINNKVYIGQAINPHRRFIQHLCNGNKLLDRYPIHLAISKYGKENFYYEILEKDIENYDEREKYWIQYYDSISPNGYNILPGGEKNPILYGKDNPKNTLTEYQIQNIIEELLYTNNSQRKIAQDNNTTERIINSITSGEAHRQNNLKYPLRIKGCHFSRKTLYEILWLLQNTKAFLQSIADFYNLTKGTIAQINSGKIHNNSLLKYPLREENGISLTCKQIGQFLLNMEEENINDN